MKRPITEREQIVASFVKGEIGRDIAAKLLGCTTRTLSHYVRQFLVYGTAGLIDHRHSNYAKLSPLVIDKIVAIKKTDRWRSPRNIRDLLELLVTPATVWRVLRRHGLTKENLKRVKAIIRFEAEAPNDLWQTDILGKIDFSHLGVLYLIATLADYSRLFPAGHWFKTQGKMNVFQIWYDSLTRWGLPKAMLQDE